MSAVLCSNLSMVREKSIITFLNRNSLVVRTRTDLMFYKGSICPALCSISSGIKMIETVWNRKLVWHVFEIRITRRLFKIDNFPPMRLVNCLNFNAI